MTQSKSYRLSELIEKLQSLQTAPVSPEAIKTGQGQVFLSVRDKDEPGKIILMRGDIEIRDMGAYIDIGIYK